MPSEAGTVRDEVAAPGERGVTAVLIVVLFTCASLALSASFSRLVHGELQAAADANHPRVAAEIGEPFQLLAPGLTERATDTSLWKAISVSLDTQDRTHPPFSSVYADTTVAARARGDGTFRPR